MTIPINPVQIHPQFAATQQPRAPGMEVLLSVLQHRQEINQRQQALDREMQQFELNKKLAGPQYENSVLDAEKKKRDLKTQQDDIAAQSEAHRLFAGSLTHIDDPQAMGEVVSQIKDPLVAQHFTQYLKEYWTNEGLRQSAQPTFETKVAPSPTSPTGFGYTAINPKNPAQNVPTGVAAPNPQAPVQRIPVVTEREKASAVIGAAQANATINQLEAADPTISVRVANKIASRKTAVGAVAKRLLGVPAEDIAAAQESIIEQSMSPDELAYYQAQKQFLGSVLPALSGKQVTAREYMMQAPPYFSMGASTPTVLQNRRKARAQRIRGFMAEAGDAMQERLGELVNPTEYQSGGPPQTSHVGPVAPQYHPQFVKPKAP